MALDGIGLRLSPPASAPGNPPCGGAAGVALTQQGRNLGPWAGGNRSAAYCTEQLVVMRDGASPTPQPTPVKGEGVGWQAPGYR